MCSVKQKKRDSATHLGKFGKAANKKYINSYSMFEKYLIPKKNIEQSQSEAATNRLIRGH